MRVGVSLSSSHRTDDAREGARWMIERTRAANAAGLDSLFVGDHHSTGPGKYYQNSPILGRLLAEWDERPAGALYLLPLWHPVLLAEQVGTLASIARGRFIMQCAVGAEDDPAFPALGVKPSQRPSRFEECLETVRALWAGETVTGTRRFPFERARIAPVPSEAVEVWIGGSAPAAIDRAARLGDGWVADPGLTPIEARERAAMYLDRTVAHGRRPKAVAIRRDIYVGADPEEARRTVAPILARGYRGFDPSALVWGSVEQVAEQFRTLSEAGFTDVIIRDLVAEPALVLESIGRLATVRGLVADA
ncbi:MAG: LLM class flavin-dependent oxidoreductase [Dehalococcoidia bacterium]|nr:MAG: LLM class flavin-dependent oxidoreductase [Dehalococcoidia bacterium]